LPECPETSCTRSYVGYNCMYECRRLGFQENDSPDLLEVLERAEVETDDIDKFKILQVSPNPVSDILTVDYDTENNLFLVMRNSNGQSLISQRLSSEQTSFSIDVKDLTSGLYFITVTDAEGNTESKKVVVTK